MYLSNIEQKYTVHNIIFTLIHTRFKNKFTTNMCMYEMKW